MHTGNEMQRLRNNAAEAEAYARSARNDVSEAVALAADLRMLRDTLGLRPGWTQGGPAMSPAHEAFENIVIALSGNGPDSHVLAAAAADIIAADGNG